VSSSPRVSVIMPTYNSASFLGDAVMSVLAQTFTDFELVVVDDGSTDETQAILAGFSDPRLVIHRSAVNTGLAAARNAGLTRSRGALIAWLDSDDISLPRRLERQVAVLERRPRVGICGTWVQTLGASRSTWRYPRRSGMVASRMLFDDPLATSSVVMRREVLCGMHAFDPEFAPAEDYDLWERASRGWEIVNIPAVLTRYRVHVSQTSVLQHQRQRFAVKLIQQRQLHRLGLTPTEKEWHLHERIGVGWGEGLRRDDQECALAWLRRLKEANDDREVYPRASFAAVLRHRVSIVKQACNPFALRRLVVRARTAAR
jgi:glycosyltransferase involved in cell wall biosynthesis